jgi:small-conductance mechanosensitive channel
MSWDRWNWLRETTTPLAVAVVRACWLWLWLELLHRWLTPSYPKELLPVPLLIGLFLSAMAATRWVSAGSKGMQDPSGLRRQRLMVAGGGLLILTLVLWWQFYGQQYRLWDVHWISALGLRLTHWGEEVPAPIITILAGAYLWLRGVLDGRYPLTHDDVWGSFAAGFVTLAVAIVTASAAGESLPKDTGNVIFLFFATSMIALAFSSLEAARSSRQNRPETELKLDRYWLASVVSVIVGLLALGLLVSAFIAPETVIRALSWVSGPLNVLGQLLYYGLYVIAYLAFLILEPLIHWLRRQFAILGPREPLQVPDFQRQLEEIARGQPAGIPPAFTEVFRWIGLAAFILAIAMAFALALRRFGAQEVDEVAETRELILSRDLVADQLSRWWHRWLRRLRRASVTALSPFLPLEGEPDTRRAIRAIYQALLSTAGEQGVPRARGQTPIEYRDILGELFPNAPGALDTITDEYVQARYSPDVPTVEQAERARQAWEELQGALTTPNGHKA